jgi:hypothetical protein
MKKHLCALLIGLGLILLGSLILRIETANYKKYNGLTSNFNFEQKVLEYNIYKDEKYRITNGGIDANISLYIDNLLSNEIRIVINHVDMLTVDSKNVTTVNDGKKIINIDLESELVLLDFKDAKEFYKLGISSIKEKIAYNYSLLKNPEVRVYVNEAYKSNIEFVNNYGKVYNPIK